MAKPDYLKEVEKTIRASSGKASAADVAFLKKYVGTQYDILGVNSPTIRAFSKAGFSFSTLDFSEQIAVWNTIWQKSSLHEAMTLAILFWERNIHKVDGHASWVHLKTWTGKIDNWAHSDGLSNLYSHLLERKPSMVLPELKKWNKSKNPWERRQSVVGLIYYYRKRKEVLPYSTLIPLVEHLLDDKDYFVQKGVGWALRELDNAYHKETFQFLKKNFARITGIAFAAAAEKLSPKEKEELKVLRKKARKK